MQHLIHTLNVTLRVPEMQKAFFMQERVKECLQAEWSADITAVLDRYSGPDVYLQIERLDIRLDGLPEQQWEKHFRQRFIEALEKALLKYGNEVVETAANAANEIEDQPWGLRSASVQYQEAWMFFMQYGLLPWWMQQESADSLEEKVVQAMQQQPQRCAALWRQAWADGKIMIQRWVQQCSPALQRAVLEALFGEKITTILTGREAMLLLSFSVNDRNVHLRRLQTLYWDVMFSLLMSSAEGADIREIKRQIKAKWEVWMQKAISITETDILEKIDFGEDERAGINADVDLPLAPEGKDELSSSHQPDKPAQPHQPDNPAQPSQPNRSTKPPHPDKKLQLSLDLGIGEHLLVKQAGVILLHPFLQYLFKAMEWLDDKGTAILPEYIHRAVHLLEYMASGEEDVPEYEMALLKLLCGLPLDTPVERNVQLTTDEKEKGMELLQAVIKHWSSLGTASADGLRGAFLLREGKLIFAEDHWQLLIEQKTVDILLNQLPWGFSIIKLPWMEQLLKVQWTTS